MTDRLKGVFVALSKELRTDDAESTINAIRHIRGVVAVEHRVADPEHYEAQAKVVNALTVALLEVLEEKSTSSTHELRQKLLAVLSDDNLTKILNPLFLT